MSVLQPKRARVRLDVIFTQSAKKLQTFLFQILKTAELSLNGEQRKAFAVTTNTIVSIAPISQSESSSAHIVAFTRHGDRIFLRVIFVYRKFGCVGKSKIFPRNISTFQKFWSVLRIDEFVFFWFPHFWSNYSVTLIFWNPQFLSKFLPLHILRIILPVRKHFQSFFRLWVRLVMYLGTRFRPS